MRWKTNQATKEEKKRICPVENALLLWLVVVRDRVVSFLSPHSRRRQMCVCMCVSGHVHTIPPSLPRCIHSFIHSSSGSELNLIFLPIPLSTLVITNPFHFSSSRPNPANKYFWEGFPRSLNTYMGLRYVENISRITKSGGCCHYSSWNVGV